MLRRAVRLALIALTGEMGYPSVLTAKTWGFYDVLFLGTDNEGHSLRVGVKGDRDPVALEACVDDIAALLEPLSSGHDVALLSEAGCPAVADPGALAEFWAAAPPQDP